MPGVHQRPAALLPSWELLRPAQALAQDVRNRVLAAAGQHFVGARHSQAHSQEHNSACMHDVNTQSPRRHKPS